MECNTEHQEASWKTNKESSDYNDIALPQAF